MTIQSSLRTILLTLIFLTSVGAEAFSQPRVTINNITGNSSGVGFDFVWTPPPTQLHSGLIAVYIAPGVIDNFPGVQSPPFPPDYFSYYCPSPLWGSYYQSTSYNTITGQYSVNSVSLPLTGDFFPNGPGRNFVIGTNNFYTIYFYVPTSGTLGNYAFYGNTYYYAQTIYIDNSGIVNFINGPIVKNTNYYTGAAAKVNNVYAYFDSGGNARLTVVGYYTYNDRPGDPTAGIYTMLNGVISNGIPGLPPYASNYGYGWYVPVVGTVDAYPIGGGPSLKGINNIYYSFDFPLSPNPAYYPNSSNYYLYFYAVDAQYNRYPAIDLLQGRTGLSVYISYTNDSPPQKRLNVSQTIQPPPNP